MKAEEMNISAKNENSGTINIKLNEIFSNSETIIVLEDQLPPGLEKQILAIARICHGRKKEEKGTLAAWKSSCHEH